MITRSERDRQSKSKNSFKKNSIYLGVIVFFALLMYGVFDHLSRTAFSPLDVLNKDYSCTRISCEYSLEVFNEDYVAVDGVVTVIAYKRVWNVDVETFEVISRDRKSLRLEGKEMINFTGSLTTNIKPSKFEIFVNVEN